MFYSLSQQLHKLPPELAHDVAIFMARYAVPQTTIPQYPILSQKIAGLIFQNPVGLAAGFDKNAVTGTNLFKLGFGFVEFGTVTPLPQIGNPKPRLFRLSAEKSIINRMGFNNAGMDRVAHQLQKTHQKKQQQQIIGINIGKNKTGDADDYIKCFARLAPYADYCVINVSSPNTPGLRDLQHVSHLQKLLSQLKEHALKSDINVPIFLKLAPDLDRQYIKDLCKILVLKNDIAIDGLILTNTTIARDNIDSPLKSEAGGLSGAPLFDISTEILRQFASQLDNKIPLIGVGGIMNGADAYQKIRAGASLLQIYTGLIYGGYDIIGKILSDLQQYLHDDGYQHISEAIGADL